MFFQDVGARGGLVSIWISGAFVFPYSYDAVMMETRMRNEDGGCDGPVAQQRVADARLPAE